MITLLQSLHGQGLPLSSFQSKTDYERLLKEIRIFSVSPQVYTLLQEKRLLEQVPDFFRQGLRADYEKLLIQNLLIKTCEEELLLAFEAEGIPVIPLKGPRFAERCFGHLGARPSSDIDLLVQPGDLERAARCTEALCYSRDKQLHNHTVLVKAVGRSSDALAVELHWSLDKKNWSSLDDRRFWEQARLLPGRRMVSELSLLHTFYFMCLHGIRHEMDSPKHLLDIVRMLDVFGEQIDLARLLEEAAMDHTSKRIKAALSITYSQFPHLALRSPLPFPMLDTHWTYQAILKKHDGQKDAEYYRYISFFKFRMFDTVKHAFLSQKQIYERTAKYSSFKGK